MQQRRKANLGINHTVAFKLLKQVLGDDAQRVFCLHELKSTRGAGEKIRQAGALRRGNKLRVVLLTRDRWREARDGPVAQRAVQMQVKFDFA